MEQTITYVVQHWNERYGFWGNVSELSEGLFTLPRVGYETEDEGRAKLSALREACPAQKYRLIRCTTTTEEI